jgi:hypothetical protein
LLRVHDIQSLLTVTGSDDFKPSTIQSADHHVAIELIIFHKQNALARSHVFSPAT